MKIRSGIRKTGTKSPPSRWHSADSKSVISLLVPASKGAAEDGSSPVTIYSVALWTGCCEGRAVAFKPLVLVEEGTTSSPALVATLGSHAGARHSPAATLPSGENQGTCGCVQVTARATLVNGFKNIHQKSGDEHNLPGFLPSHLPQTPFCF